MLIFFAVSVLTHRSCVLIYLTVWKDWALVVGFHSRLFHLCSFFIKCKIEKLLLVSVLFITLYVFPIIPYCRTFPLAVYRLVLSLSSRGDSCFGKTFRMKSPVIFTDPIHVFIFVVHVLSYTVDRSLFSLPISFCVAPAFLCLFSTVLGTSDESNFGLSIDVSVTHVCFKILGNPILLGILT